MGNTPNFAIPYPEPTDFVADGANQMENLAERSDDALYALGMGRNRLINGDFRVAQRGTNFQAGANNDNTYNLDRWVVLSDGNDIVDINQSNVAPSGGLFSIGLDVETVNKKFGILQVIEQRNIVGMFNQPVTLSFSARTSGTSIGNMKAVILAWTGTGNTVTRDVVSAWGADGVTPTFAANWTAENTPQNLAPSNDWTRYAITATLDTASTNNVAVFIWCDDMTTTLGDFLYITDVQLEVGALATPFERKSYADELLACQRYFQVHTFNIGGYSGFADSTTSFLGVAQFIVEPRSAPSLSPAPTAADFEVRRAGVTASAVTAISANTSVFGCRITATTGATLSAGAGGIFTAVTGTKFLYWSAEL